MKFQSFPCVYDALYRWLKFCRGEKHLWFPPTSRPGAAS